MKKLIIAGGGISGLSAGIFAQAAGIHTMILEKNRVPGGLCTGWNRYGFHIDGCIRELAGFRPDGELFRLFRLTGALEDTWLRRPPVILTVEHQGEVLQVYRDREAFLDELTWASREDRDRIRALGELLEAAGVDTVPELSKRKGENLLSKMAEVNQKKKLVRRLPVQTQVDDWIRQAGELPRVLTY